MPSPEQAIAAEKQIKGWTRKKKEAMREDWDALRLLAASRNGSTSKRLWDQDWMTKEEAKRRLRIEGHSRHGSYPNVRTRTSTRAQCDGAFLAGQC